MRSAIFMMALSMSISIGFATEWKPPTVPCSEPVKQCPATDATCGTYYYWSVDNKNFCFLVCKCGDQNTCLTDEDHAIVLGNETHPNTIYTCKPISKIPECDKDKTTLLPLGGLLMKVPCKCLGGYQRLRDGSYKCR
uniref:Superfamily Tand-01 n=1 Tax=Conus magus TaxID=6492 RepID=A0A5P8I108_CONMA|nr:superfamily Tand-01 [Conus magus]